MNPELSISRRLRSTPFTEQVKACGVKGYTVYNHMLLATYFRSVEEDYWHLCENVQVWDVSCERQVEIKGPDAQQLIQLMTPRDLSQSKLGQCFYIPLCDENGMMMNDPIAIKHHDDHWWLSIASSDIILWAKGLATGLKLDVSINEPDIWPLAVQGPKAEELVSRVFGDIVKDIRFFRFSELNYRGSNMLVARSGWSKQGGFEIYVNNAELGRQLWDELFAKGADLNVGPGCPNLIERVESGLLSFGNDMDYDTTPLECGLEKFINLESDINSLSIEALRQQKQQNKIQQQLVGLVTDSKKTLPDTIVIDGNQVADVRTQVWSPRYGKQLAFVMMKSNYLQNNSTILIEGDLVKITDLPFSQSVLTA